MPINLSSFAAIVTPLIISDLQTNMIVEANPAASEMFGCTAQEMAGKPYLDFVNSACWDRFGEYIQSIHDGVPLEMGITHRRKDGSRFYVEMKGAAFDYTGRACIMSSLHDVSHWIESEESFQRQTEAHLREQATLLEISQTLASTLELKPGIVLDQLGVVIEYMHAVRFQLNNMTLVAESARGSSLLEQAVPFDIHVSDFHILETLFNEHRPTRINDVWSDEPDARFLRTILNDKMTGLLVGMRAWMWVPIAVKGRLLGGLCVTHSEEGFFTAHHADLALTVANQAAIAMANAELYVHAQALAAIQERQRLARDLHDAVNQSLFSAGLIAEVLPRLWDKNPEEARESLEDLRRLTHGAQADMRLLLAELRPNTLTDSDLGDLLQLLANALTGRTNIPVNLTVNGDPNLSGDVQVAFYRLCQEAFNDIAKHSHATRVDVQLRFSDVAADLLIFDDGQGFNPDQNLPGHYGLSMMKERAAAAGISISINSRAGLGTTVSIHWQTK